MSLSTKPFYTEGDFKRILDEGDAGEPYRSPWRKDYARLIHSPSFRRLQGKTQLFPGESDFFRNRLTHSIEVAQIAKSIAIRLNHETTEIKPGLGEHHAISTDLVEFAALAHDLGHPPFGHNGEKALDECMCSMGGFEGNAQTLRLLTKIEKKRTETYPEPYEYLNGRDVRLGLNPTFRSIASILKYDHEIPSRAPNSKIEKGYYSSEVNVVAAARNAILGDYHHEGDLSVVKCQIMDIADDIAYSTYDLEDAIRAGFTSPLDLLSIAKQDNLLTSLAITVWKRLNGRKEDVSAENIPPELSDAINAEKNAIIDILFEIALELVPDWRGLNISESSTDAEKQGALFMAVAYSHQASKRVQSNGYLRTDLTSSLVGEFVRSISLDFNSECPALSKVQITKAAKRKIEVLKNYTYEAHIMAARLKTVEFRGKEIVKDIFGCLKDDNTNQLLPIDWKIRCQPHAEGEAGRLRSVCNFVAGMTDRYALEFYQKLRSANVSTIYRED